MARLPIYLDHQATTPVDPRVQEAMQPYFREDFGNAASRTHSFGWRAEAAVEEARERIAAALGAQPREIIFTSGATEANNLALLGAARARKKQGEHVVTVATEHPAVLDPCRALAKEGFAVAELGVASDGLLPVDVLRDALTERTVLVSVMFANNEIGVIQPIRELAALCRERGIAFHSDAAQAVGKLEIDLSALPIDLLSISGHKLYGPKGIGALFVRSSRPRVRLEPIMHGGGHERGLRPGTLAVALIVGLAEALELCLQEREQEARRELELRDRLWQILRSELPGARCNGSLERRLPGNLNVSFEHVDADRLLLALPDLALSSGSACTSASPAPSHVLEALGLPPALARASLRIGLGRGTTAEQVEQAAKRIVEAVLGQREADGAGV